MKQKGEMSRRKAWLLALASLADEAIIIALIFLGLRYFRIPITWPIIVAVILAAVIIFIILHRAIVPALRRRRTTGAEGMLGLTGRVTQPLQPQGVIKINDEYWKARAVDITIEEGEEVEVVGMDGLVLEVKRKSP